MNNSIDTLRDLLPQRYPFIMIDKIIEVVPGEKLVAIKNVSLNEPYFQGHFPENPIMPGVMILEAMAQASIILAKKTEPDFNKNSLQVFAGIDKARFKQMVLPGDQLELHVTPLKKRGGIWKMLCEAKVDGAVVCSAEITSAIKEY